MSDQAQEWRWVGEDGVQKTVTEPELIAELSSESLPNYVLVWKSGWLEWLPAMQVEELAWALPPGKADEPVRAREKTGAQAPAPPLYRYPVIKRRATSLRSERPPSERPPPRPPVKAAPVPPLEPRTAVRFEEKTEPFMHAFPLDSDPGLGSNPFEEVEMASIEASNPRAAALSMTEEAELIDAESEPDATRDFDFGHGRRQYGEDDEVETRVVPSKPPPPMGPPGPTYVAPHVPPASERPPESYDEDEMPQIPRPPPPPPADLSEYANALGPRDALPTAPPGRSKTIYLVGAALALIVVLVVVLATSSGSEDASPAGSASAGAAGEGEGHPAARSDLPMASAHVEKALHPPAAPTPATRKKQAALTGTPCSLVTQATRVADWADPGVMPSFASIPGSSRIAVGFAQSDTYAIGITIDSRTLDRDQVFREFRKAKLVSVVPTGGAGKLQFQVSRAGGDLASGRAVDALTPFLVGSTETGIARQVGKKPPEAIWTFDGADQITVPRVATVRDVGHAVTFRKGGKSGKVAAGWLDPNGKKKTSLLEIAAEGAFAGTPAIAANESSILVAFASRASVDSPWWVSIATAPHGKVPVRAERFEPPTGGPGGDAMSPTVAPLSGNRWLLQWTEGAAGSRVVRVQVLGNDMIPMAEPVNISPPGANAGQGAAWTEGTTASVLFYVQNDKKSHELWGTSVECPR